MPKKKLRAKNDRAVCEMIFRIDAPLVGGGLRQDFNP